MKLSALLLTLVIGLGTTASLDAKTTKYKAPKAHHNSASKAPKVNRKPTKTKKMKFRKPKRSAQTHSVKPHSHKVRQAKAQKSV